jgi:hypothetical protein
LIHRLRNPEVDDFGDGFAVVERDEDVRGLEIAVDAPFLVGVLDPAKLDTLNSKRAVNSKRAATPRLRKACYWLHTTSNPAEAIKRAQIQNRSHGTPRAQETASALLRNLTILERLGCLTPEGLEKLRRGNAPTISKGPYAGELATVDHIIPRSVCPELDNKLFNLEFMPDSINRRKSDKIQST